DREEFAGRDVVERGCDGSRRGARFLLVTTFPRPLRAEGETERGLRQPRPDQVGTPHRVGLAGEQKERRLEDVLRRLLIADDAPGDAEHPRPVLLEQGGERLTIAAVAEAVEQVAVGGRGRPLADEQGAQVADQGLSGWRQGGVLRARPSPV